MNVHEPNRGIWACAFEQHILFFSGSIPVHRLWVKPWRKKKTNKQTNKTGREHERPSFLSPVPHFLAHFRSPPFNQIFAVCKFNLHGNWYPGDYANNSLKEFTRVSPHHSTRGRKSEEVRGFFTFVVRQVFKFFYILNHPCSFMVYYFLFGVFLPW